MKNKESLIVINIDKIIKINRINKDKSNRLKGKYPYSIQDGLYVRVLGFNPQEMKIHYLTLKQAKEINNLIRAKKMIDIEIKNILKS